MKRCYCSTIRTGKTKNSDDTNAGEDVEKLNYLRIASGNECKMVQSPWRTVHSFLKKKNKPNHALTISQQLHSWAFIPEK